jgi:hypothetical protein
MAKRFFVQRFGLGARLGTMAVVAVLGAALAAPAVLAQGFGFGRQGGGMFDSFFSPFSPPRSAPVDRPAADFTRAPPPRKLDNQPNDNVLVLGDSMADWLAYGLEDALGDSPDLAVVRKHRASAGLIHYDPRNETQDWAHVAREAIAATKPKFVVMMLGLNDRQAIRERVQPSRAAAAANSTTPPPLVPQTPDLAAPPNAADAERGPPDEPASVPEPPSKPGALRTYEFRTEEWAEQYSRRIDATLAALKSGGVPVFWVGLPSIRGPKSTSDMLYLNDLFRTRAEKAGVTYIDVWDGFVDDGGRYMVQGPDFEGQTRRLRVSDGVHFTKAGARKLAHYVEREIRRAMTHGLEPVALPMGEPQPAPSAVAPGAMAARPLAGPAVSLTSLTGAGQDLAGAGNTGPVFGTKSASRVMVNGDAITAPAGRSDDFKWPRRGIAPFGTDPAVATTSDPAVAPTPPAPPAAVVADTKPADAKSSRKATRNSSQSQNQGRRNSARSQRSYSGR